MERVQLGREEENKGDTMTGAELVVWRERESGSLIGCADERSRPMVARARAQVVLVREEEGRADDTSSAI